MIERRAPEERERRHEHPAVPDRDEFGHPRPGLLLEQRDRVRTVGAGCHWPCADRGEHPDGQPGRARPGPRRSDRRRRHADAKRAGRLPRHPSSGAGSGRNGRTHVSILLIAAGPALRRHTPSCRDRRAAWSSPTGEGRPTPAPASPRRTRAPVGDPTGALDTGVVEVAGIEPASFDASPGLLRAQSACLYSAPPIMQTSRCDGPSRCLLSRARPRPARTVSHLADARIRADDEPGLTDSPSYCQAARAKSRDWNRRLCCFATDG